MPGIAAYGTYLPRFVLERADIDLKVLGVSRPSGCRSVACFDEDSTTLGAASLAQALAVLPAPVQPDALWFVSATPAYLEKTNACAIHAAAGMAEQVRALDVAGARGGLSALATALERSGTTAVVLSDVRDGRPGGSDEATGGDGSASFVCTDAGPVVAELLGSGSVTVEVLERWRLPGSPTSRSWEEHFGADIYPPLGARALDEALKAAGLTVADVDRLAVASTNARAAQSLTRRAGVRREALVAGHLDDIGNTGAAHAGLLLAAALDDAEPGAVIAVVTMGDGADALVFRTTEHLAEARPPSLQSQLDAERRRIPYTAFLSWRGMLEVEPLRRPVPASPLGPTARRATPWKFGFSASRCTECDARCAPPQRVCPSCHATDRMRPEPLSRAHGTVVASTVDRLAWSPQPPACFAVADFDDGGRAELEVTECTIDELAPGLRVAPTFRRAFTAGDVHNYVWKFRPVRGEEA